MQQLPHLYNKKSTQDSLYVIALGASAGGHQAIWEFFAQLPPTSKAAFVIVQHLKADMTSIADQLLAKHTSIPISWAYHQQRLQANHIYILPPGKYMTLLGDKLQVVDRPPLKKINQAIDIFFESLANQQGKYGIGIILSGSGSDGTQGAIHRHQQGGRILVQDPATASFPHMPITAIMEDHVELICSPQALARAIQRLVDLP